MELMEVILSQSNMERAIKAVRSNKGAPGIDKCFCYPEMTKNCST